MREHVYTWSHGPDAKADAEAIERKLIYGIGGLRDHFAAAALTGLVATPSTDGETVSTLSESAYRFADAMLEARKAKP